MKPWIKYLLIFLLVIYLLIASYGKLRDGANLLFQDVQQNFFDQIH